MTWEETEQELIRLKAILASLHNRPERDWEIHERDAARIARGKCIELGEYRYSLLRKKIPVQDKKNLIKELLGVNRD